ncbi:MAG: glutamyl-tRNA reductase [Planctomycetota bacterium]|jgi:glutamyl-tRNA reductase|nr:glutamyl-tRNA reductase [Planctomycetota bacterium]
MSSDVSISSSRLHLVGASHKTLPLDLRERLSVGSEELPTVLSALQSDGSEAVVLSTCNRVEVYLFSSISECVNPGWEVLTRFEPELAALNGDRVYRAKGLPVGKHLFRVAAGLESQIVGEHQILGQVRDSYRRALEYGAVGGVLDRLFRQAIHVGKRVRNETSLSVGAAHHGSAAVELAERMFGDLSRHSVLLIGAGDTGKLLARQLVDKHVGELSIANRTPGKAEELARSLGGQTVEVSRVPDILHEMDIVISATSSPKSVIRYDQVAAAMRTRSYRPLLIIDIAVPRDFDPQIGEIEGCFLKSIEDLDSIIEANIQERISEVPAVEQIIEEEYTQLENWSVSLRSEPTIRGLRGRVDGILEEVLSRHGKKFRPEDRVQLELFGKALLSRVLHDPICRVKGSNQASPLGTARLALIRELFGLDEETGRRS